MTMDEVLKIEDIDQRTQAIKFAKTGLREFYKQEGGKMIDNYVKLMEDGEPINYELWKIPPGKIFSDTVNFMIYDCPSSKRQGNPREYSKGVPSSFKKVANTMAWGMSNDIYTISPDQWKQMIPLIHES